jgi:hypothetical protein
MFSSNQKLVPVKNHGEAGPFCSWTQLHDVRGYEFPVDFEAQLN